MNTADRFSYRTWLAHASRDAMVGVYLDPPALLGTAEETRRDRAPEKLASAPVLDHGVTITRMTGLFVERPPDLVTIDDAFSKLSPSNPWSDVDFGSHLMTDEKREFAESVSRAFNAVACELMFVTGRPRAAIAPASILSGSADAERIAVDTSKGNHETFEASRRVSNQWLFAEEDEWTEGWHRASSADGVAALEGRRTSQLISISTDLPELILTAYRAFELEQANASAIAAWTACEIIVGDWWRQIHEARPASEWNFFLGNDRESIAKRIEYLFLARSIDANLRDTLQLARKQRNRIAHRAQGSHAAARDCIESLRSVLAVTIGEVPPLATRSSMVHW